MTYAASCTRWSRCSDDERGISHDIRRLMARAGIAPISRRGARSPACAHTLDGQARCGTLANPTAPCGRLCSALTFSDTTASGPGHCQSATGAGWIGRPPRTMGLRPDNAVRGAKGHGGRHAEVVRASRGDRLLCVTVNKPGCCRPRVDTIARDEIRYRPEPVRPCGAQRAQLAGVPL